MVLGISGGVVLAGALWWCNRVVEAEARGRCYGDIQAVPQRRVGLVLGTGKWLGGGAENPYYRARLQAAAALYRQGKVQFLLVSGDRGGASYDEPSWMTADLVALGVPADRIYQDYAGFRTLDSVIRAKKVFALSEITVVSQHFHNVRAIYLAKSQGIDAVGFDARPVGGLLAERVAARETVSRLFAILETRVWQGRARVLGPVVKIGGGGSVPQTVTCFKMVILGLYT